jgi:hypothetical protein
MLAIGGHDCLAIATSARQAGRKGSDQEKPAVRLGRWAFIATKSKEDRER